MNQKVFSADDALYDDNVKLIRIRTKILNENTLDENGDYLDDIIDEKIRRDVLEEEMNLKN